MRPVAEPAVPLPPAARRARAGVWLVAHRGALLAAVLVVADPAIRLARALALGLPSEPIRLVSALEAPLAGGLLLALAGALYAIRPAGHGRRLWAAGALALGATEIVGLGLLVARTFGRGGPEAELGANALVGAAALAAALALPAGALAARFPYRSARIRSLALALLAAVGGFLPLFAVVVNADPDALELVALSDALASLAPLGWGLLAAVMAADGAAWPRRGRVLLALGSIALLAVPAAQAALVFFPAVGPALPGLGFEIGVVVGQLALLAGALRAWRTPPEPPGPLRPEARRARR